MPSPISRSRAKGGSSARQRSRESAWSTARFVLALAVIAWALRSFVVAPFYIPSGSMLPTLYIGDYLAVAKWPYGYSRYSLLFGFPRFDGRLRGQLPKRGDVVVFRHPTETADLIKRVIGLPGDKVELRDGELILNGRLVPRMALAPYKLPISANTPCRMVGPSSPSVVRIGSANLCLIPAYREALPGGPSYTILDQGTVAADNFGPVKVPAGHVFLMGDNRDDSADSRFSTQENGVGMLPTQNLIGRATFTFWSTDGTASWWKPWTWFSALRASRIGNGYEGDAE